jgi:nucleoside-diphosphate-sugar epimerase
MVVKLKALIIGAGYVGSALLKHWQNKGYALYTTTLSEDKMVTLRPFAKDVYLLKGNDHTLLPQLIEKMDVISVTIAPKALSNYRDCYLETAKNLVFILRHCHKMPYILYTSSTSVYGNHGGKIVDEAAERLNNTENGKILIKTEDLYLSYQNSCVLRLGGIHGPGRTLSMRAQRLSNSYLPDAEHPTNNVALKEILQAIDVCVAKKNQGVFNVVSDSHPTKKELYLPLCAELKIPPPLFIDEGGEISSHSSYCIVSNAKIKRTF